MKKLKMIVGFVLITCNLMSFASDLPAVSSKGCQHVLDTQKPFILVLKTDENLPQALLNCARDAHIVSASLSGIGALKDTTLIFRHGTKSNPEKTFKPVMEMISLNGNIATLDGEQVTHLHVVLGNEDYQLIGGHLFDATVGPTAEITITPLMGPITKKTPEGSHVNLMVPEY